MNGSNTDGAEDVDAIGNDGGAVSSKTSNRRFDGEAKAADLSARMFWSPSPARSTALILLLSIILGLPIFYRPGIPLVDQPLLPVAIVSLFAASVLSAAVTQWFCSREGVMYPRRAFLLSFIGVGIAIPGVLLGTVIPGAGGLVMVGLATPVWIRHVALVGTSDPRHVRNVAPALSQTVLMTVAVAPFVYLGSFEIAVLVNASLAFLAGAFLFLSIVSGPMKRVFGVTPYELLVSGLEHFTTSGGLEAESFFYGISSKASVWYSYIRIRRERKPDVHMVTTTLHPGPFGLFGGSDLPTKLRRMTEWRNLMVFHGPCGHDMNPPRTEDVERFARELKEAARAVEMDGGASSPTLGGDDEMHITAQSIGGTAIMTFTRAPEPTDDIDPPVGMSALEALKRSTGRECGFFVDAHNSLRPGVGSIHYGDPVSRTMRDAAAVMSLGDDGDFKAGYSERSSVEFGGDVGDMAVQALVIEAGRIRFAYILLDGNNMVQGLRGKLLGSVSDLVDTAEVCTTDNHSVNRTIGGYRPVGLETPVAALQRAVRTAVRDAIADLSDARSGGVEGYVEDLPVLGHGTTAKLTALVNATAGTTRWAFVASVSFSVAVSLIPIFAL